MTTLAVYGRLTADPREIETPAGKAMTAASIAVNLTSRNEKPAMSGGSLESSGQMNITEVTREE